MPKENMSYASSFESLFCHSPDPSKFLVFGCLYFPWLRPYKSHKLDHKSSVFVFLGYSLTQSAFLCYDLSCHKVFVLYHVKFVEHEVPFSTFVPTSISPVESLVDITSLLISMSSLSLSDLPTLVPTPSIRQMIHLPHIPTPLYLSLDFRIPYFQNSATPLSLHSAFTLN